MAIPIVLSISGSDSSGADGLQADLRTFAALRTHGASVITVVTAQNTREVTAAEVLAPALVEAQIRAVFADLDVRAVKIGALGTAEMVEAVARTLSDCCTVPLVVDPVMVSRGGDVLVEAPVGEAYRARLLPMAAVATPNMDEAALLTQTAVAETQGDLLEQARAICALGCGHVVVSGGHGRSDTVTDILATRDRPPIQLRTERLDRQNMRGLSSTFSAAIAAHIAHDLIPYESIQFAKLFLTGAIEAADTFSIGDGPGPIHQMHRMWETSTDGRLEE